MSADKLVYRLEWDAGPGAQIEVFSPESKNASLYQIKYIPPLRSAIRPPVDVRPLGPKELEPIDEMLDTFVASSLKPGGRGPDGAGHAPAANLDAGLQELGGLLYDLIVPRAVQADLRPTGVFLEFGMDQGLLRYPWELMHDGSDFLCMKHAFGRFVNSTTPIPSDTSPHSLWDAKPQEISVLLVSVSKPEPRDGQEFPEIPYVREEAEKIAETLTDIPGVKIEWLPEEKAVFGDVVKKLRKNRYDIVHFCGHAYSNAAKPEQSSLVLHNRSLTTGTIVVTFAKNRPTICFINACESATSLEGKDRFNVYGLAGAFLEAGSYLIGSRWRILDAAASVFAPEFYSRFLGDGDPLGLAVRKARQLCLKNQPNDFAWASYVFYGDPRVCFRAGSKSGPPELNGGQIPGPGEIGQSIDVGKVDSR
ncbi:MAG: CHAT domain-containing protein [Isosphaeraceae bacterium]